ncbi:nascent polypeptide-associated complex subunit alpha, muscle-specific form-like isoform X4 [Corvus moneduloides]|uniref:nascent polypeptide-associated complex subunit alpha, muscle-specific form-like isoform X4 n=1 Tax=Corvus moneduloides TaxID=1196302 RepID=UPI0013620DDE|nr:nascent polypeptide-associated complex subunit alpha, muscle-specific form-like isoform X4 [Corvus moneduloides]XP_031953700.1 nascent polypeptide-associated complex subunit alpha, muscle-specific form-like isoform X4 [Corvus moneduloides]XP_031953701.1 nascent polypeptide-associated complex subunit alpha, muscle-specific form-like isoform X4 [Corvus moneduloides]
MAPNAAPQPPRPRPGQEVTEAVPVVLPMQWKPTVRAGMFTPLGEGLGGEQHLGQFPALFPSRFRLFPTPLGHGGHGTKAPNAAPQPPRPRPGQEVTEAVPVVLPMQWKPTVRAGMFTPLAKVSVANSTWGSFPPFFPPVFASFPPHWDMEDTAPRPRTLPHSPPGPAPGRRSRKLFPSCCRCSGSRRFVPACSPPWRRSRWRTAPGAAKPKRRRDPPEKKEREKGRREEEKQVELGRGGAGRGKAAGEAWGRRPLCPPRRREHPAVSRPFSLPFSPLSHPTGTWRTRHHGPERCPTAPPAPPRAGGHGSCSRRVADAVEADGSCRHVHPHGEGLGGEQHLGQFPALFPSRFRLFPTPLGHGGHGTKAPNAAPQPPRPRPGQEVTEAVPVVLPMQWKPTVRAGMFTPLAKVSVANSTWGSFPPFFPPVFASFPPHWDMEDTAPWPRTLPHSPPGPAPGRRSRKLFPSCCRCSGSRRFVPACSPPWRRSRWRTAPGAAPPAPPRAGGHGSCSRRVADAVEADGSCRHVHPHGEGLGGEQHLGQVWGRFGAVWVRFGAGFWGSFWVSLEQFWVRFGAGFWGRFGASLEQFWVRFRAVFGAGLVEVWGRFR